VLLTLNLKAFFTHDLALVRIASLGKRFEDEGTQDTSGNKITLDTKGIKRMDPTVPNDGK
jgi:hypothetical protein